MKTCDCHVPGFPATHRNPRSGFLLCSLSAERAVERLDALVASRRPVPLPDAAPSLFDEAV